MNSKKNIFLYAKIVFAFSIIMFFSGEDCLSSKDAVAGFDAAPVIATFGVNNEVTGPVNDLIFTVKITNNAYYNTTTTYGSSPLIGSQPAEKKVYYGSSGIFAYVKIYRSLTDTAAIAIYPLSPKDYLKDNLAHDFNAIIPISQPGSYFCSVVAKTYGSMISGTEVQKAGKLIVTATGADTLQFLNIGKFYLTAWESSEGGTGTRRYVMPVGSIDTSKNYIEFKDAFNCNIRAKLGFDTSVTNSYPWLQNVDYNYTGKYAYVRRTVPQKLYIYAMDNVVVQFTYNLSGSGLYLTYKDGKGDISIAYFMRIRQ